MAKQTANFGRRWFAIHTYSGYEENVAENLTQRIETMDMQEKIFNVLVPKEKKIKIKNGKRKTVEEKIFPGYVLVEMVVTDDSWYVVRNTPNVTGFIGTGTTPTPIAETEMEALQKRMGINEPEYKLDVENRLTRVETHLTEIKDNHLPHIEAKLDRATWLLITTLVGLSVSVTMQWLGIL